MSASASRCAACRHEIERRVGEALAMVQLTGLGARRPLQLSGRTAAARGLARALVIRPAMLLLDEPLSNLDLKLREEMRVEISGAAAPARHCHGVRHARPGRGADHVGPHRGDAQRPHRADRHAQPTSMSVRRPVSSPSFIGAINMLAGQDRSARCDRRLGRLATSAGPALAGCQPDLPQAPR